MRPTPFRLPFRIDGWLIDHVRWYRQRYYTHTAQFDGTSDA